LVEGFIQVDLLYMAEEECYEQPKDEVEPDAVSGWVVVELDLSLVAL
jgi:hypothetical protein